jgi:hypothetical protein
MSTLRLLPLALIFAGACNHAYVAFGYDAAKQQRGSVMGMAQVGGSSSAASNGSVAIGGGSKTGGIEARVQQHDVDSTLMGPDRFQAMSGALEGRLVPIHVGPVGLILHAGPALGAVADKTMGDVTYGVGFRAGGGAQVWCRGVALWVDAAREELTFGGEVVNGRGDRDVVSVGIRVGGR